MRFAILLVLTLLAGCSKPPEVKPALWEVTGPQGQQAWLLGTIHALPEAVDWRSPAVDSALARSDRLIVEVADGGDPEKSAEVFARLGQRAGLPPLEQRIPADFRDELADLLGNQATRLDGLESWAAALTLAQLIDDGAEASHGIDAALIRAAGSKPIDQFEGLEGQLSIFDSLPEDDQRALLSETLSSLPSAKQDTAQLSQWWASGDMNAIAAASDKGLLADPDLRRVLLVERNQSWLAQLTARLRRGERPLVAVGAAHLAGADGLPAQLAAQGWQVRRVQ